MEKVGLAQVAGGLLLEVSTAQSRAIKRKENYVRDRLIPKMKSSLDQFSSVQFKTVSKRSEKPTIMRSLRLSQVPECCL